MVRGNDIPTEVLISDVPVREDSGKEWIINSPGKNRGFTFNESTELKKRYKTASSANTFTRNGMCFSLFVRLLSFYNHYRFPPILSESS